MLVKKNTDENAQFAEAIKQFTASKAFVLAAEDDRQLSAMLDELKLQNDRLMRDLDETRTLMKTLEPLWQSSSDGQDPKVTEDAKDVAVQFIEKTTQPTWLIWYYRLFGSAPSRGYLRKLLLQKGCHTSTARRESGASQHHR